MPTLVVDGLVSRTDQLDRVLDGIRRNLDGTVTVLGAKGMGKTSFLGLLRTAIQRDFPDVVMMPIRANMTAEPYGLSEDYRGEYGPDATTVVSALLLEKSTQFLGDLAQAAARQFPGFLIAAEATRSAANTVTVNNTFTAKTWGRLSNTALEMNVGGESPIERIRQAQRSVDEAFVADWRNFIAGRRAVLIIDGFETLIDDAVGQWFVRLAARLPDTTVVLSLVPREFAEHGQRVLDPALVQELPRFTTAETHAYLAHHFGDQVGPRLTGVVYGFTGGHPYGLSLVVQFMRARREEALDPGRLQDLLSQLSQGDRQVGDLVRAVIRPERNPDVWRVAEIASLLNSFDVPMLVSILAGEDLATAPERVGDAVRRIEHFGFTDPLPVVGRFRLHDFIRPSMSEALREFQPERWTHIHRRAAAYYYERIMSLEDKTSTVYGSWFKYENVEWQMYEAEWLSHSAQLVDEREVVRAQFIVLFLEAFWWWALYVDFSFCHQLLDSWQRATRDDLDRDLVKEMRRFHGNYPTGPDKPAGAHWTEVRHALRTIGQLCGVHNGWQDARYSAEVQQIRRKAWLYLGLFTAHSYWYDGQFGAADATYRRLEPEFLDHDDEWLLAWIYFEWAKVALAAGDRPSAGARCRQSSGWLRKLAETGESESELLANLHRLLGDLFSDTDRTIAAQQYGQAVKRAFVFHLSDDPLGPAVSGPDEYTAQFYAEMTSRAAAGLADWWQDPRREALLTALVEPTAGKVPLTIQADLDLDVGPMETRRQVVERVLPRGPHADELYRRSGTFIDYWGDVVEHLNLNVAAELDRIDELAARLMGSSAE
ncbi:AAA family ATPase [Micromonospora luteifusca]|nr:AAA family ATPase [Micromonospora luteifusca]